MIRACCLGAKQPARPLDSAKRPAHTTRISAGRSEGRTDALHGVVHHFLNEACAHHLAREVAHALLHRPDLHEVVHALHHLSTLAYGARHLDHRCTRALGVSVSCGAGEQVLCNR